MPFSSLRPKKKLGQNFLIDGNLMTKIVEAAEIEPHDVVLEIGAGTGFNAALIAAALAEAEREGEVDWFELAAATLARRYSQPDSTPRERARRERFLASRGFEFEHVRYALERLDSVE